MNRTFYICITIMDDPLYKQSSIRVADALGRAGHRVTLIGRRLPGERTATDDDERAAEQTGDTFRRVRFRCLFRKGKLFYAEMNLRLFFYLLVNRVDLVCAVNLDTILPCWAVSELKGIPRIYDARELFTEMAEVVARPRIQRAWLWVEKNMVPRFPDGYAVCQSIADVFYRRYGVRYAVVRNMTVLKEPVPSPRPMERQYLLYQGAVNVGRGLDALIPAMQQIDLPIVICGTGNYMDQCRKLVDQYGLEQKIFFMGQLSPFQLRQYTDHAFIGINLVERAGLNQYYSLPNKLFDYIHSGLPQVTMDYPEYRRVQEVFEIGVLIRDVQTDLIVEGVQRLVNDQVLYERLRTNCLEAKLVFNWQQEEPVLLDVYQKVIGDGD
jgi:glycosyltransferase involved in cell wall biosynthesis